MTTAVAAALKDGICPSPALLITSTGTLHDQQWTAQARRVAFAVPEDRHEISSGHRTDVIARRVLLELGRDGRPLMGDLAHRVPISRACAYTRVHRLVREGVIERFTALVSPAGVGLGASA